MSSEFSAECSRASRATVVCILGMHRSGTSLTSRLLNLLGVDLGTDRSIETAGPDNIKGYWEHRPLADVNDAILARFDGRWDSPPAFPEDWVHDPRLADLFERARRLLIQDFDGAPLWGWKDPRTSVTLPFWQELIGPMRYVICVRSPSAVISSLARRDQMHPPAADGLWLRYMVEILRHTSGYARLFVMYEDLMTNWPHELGRLAAFVGRGEMADDSKVRAASADFIESELWHHRPTLEQLAADPLVSVFSKSVYFSVCAQTVALPRSGTMACTDVDERAHKTLALAASQALAESERAQAAVERDAAFALEAWELWNADAERRTIERTHATETRAALQAIHASRDWKRIVKWRARMGALLPEGTRRRRLYRLARRWKASSAEASDRAPSPPAADLCLCTLAVHSPYRKRARTLCADVVSTPWVVATDEPADFVDMPVRTLRIAPTGPMAVDYLLRLSPTGEGRGAAAYHDKRFAVREALEQHDTAVFLDADSRIATLPRLPVFPSGLAVLPVVRKSVAEHLETCGSWRVPAFVALARHLMGDASVLHRARWCHETCFAVTKDGNERRFFWAWERAAAFMQARGVFSGEGGVMGLAAAFAGWSVNYDVLVPFGDSVHHEGGGPKEA